MTRLTINGMDYLSVDDVIIMLDSMRYDMEKGQEMWMACLGSGDLINPIEAIVRITTRQDYSQVYKVIDRYRKNLEEWLK